MDSIFDLVFGSHSHVLIISLNRDVVFLISKIKHLSVFMNCSTCANVYIHSQVCVLIVCRDKFTCSSIKVSFRSRQCVASERIATLVMIFLISCWINQNCLASNMKVSGMFALVIGTEFRSKTETPFVSTCMYAVAVPCLRPTVSTVVAIVDLTQSCAENYHLKCQIRRIKSILPWFCSESRPLIPVSLGIL